MIRYLIIATLLAIVIYGTWEATPLIAGPSLTIASPTNYAPFPEGHVTIRGEARRVAQLTLNGAPLLRDEEGRFSTTLTFPQGNSILTVVATDRFDRTVTETRTIFVPSSRNQL